MKFIRKNDRGFSRSLKNTDKAIFGCGSKPEAYRYGIVHFLHKYVIQVPHFFAQTALIERAYLLEQDNGVFGKTEFLGVNVYVCRKLRFIELTCYCGGYHRWAILVANVVLNY